MFVDLAGFTDLAAKIAPPELIDILNEIFSSFDVLMDIFKSEKIKTIGDSYMAVGGLDNKGPQTDSMVELAFMLAPLSQV